MGCWGILILASKSGCFLPTTHTHIHTPLYALQLDWQAVRSQHPAKAKMGPKSSTVGSCFLSALWKEAAKLLDLAPKTKKPGCCDQQLVRRNPGQDRLDSQLHSHPTKATPPFLQQEGGGTEEICNTGTGTDQALRTSLLFRIGVKRRKLRGQWHTEGNVLLQPR